jgi:hypothetical protein
MAKAKVRMAINPFRTVEKALEKVRLDFKPEKIVSIDYEEADILYVKFKQSKIVDNEPLDEKGLILASLNKLNL